MWHTLSNAFSESNNTSHEGSEVFEVVVEDSIGKLKKLIVDTELWTKSGLM